MKYKILSFFKRITAAVIAFFISIFGNSAEPVDNVKENEILPYNTSTADYTLDINADEEIHDISELLFGIFFEDINFAADGGLYAEKVVNRSFEFGDTAKDDQFYGWKTVGAIEKNIIINDSLNSLNENNRNYIIISNKSGVPAGIENIGFLDGMNLVKDAEYNFSVYAKAIDGYNGKITVQLCVGENTAGSAVINNISDKWSQYKLTLNSNQTANSNVTLRILTDNGSVALDMISLFPKDTFKGRENGMRKDLATMLEELEPKFLRFPGGCIIEGYDDKTAYDWKDSIGVDSDGNPLLFNGRYGDVAARKQGTNLWTNLSMTDDPYPSFMTYGLGFFEYFQLAEDIGAIGVPVINCGLYCQMRGQGPVDLNTAEFEQYIQDMIDLVEFCRGNEDTKWGAVRASLGHPEPFELKYICIGNEN